MSRVFDNTLTNYLSLGVGGISALLSGLDAVSVSAWIYPTAVSTVGVNDNGILTAIDNSSSVGLNLNLDATGGTNKVRINGRSVNSETRVGRSSSATFSLSQWLHAGGTLDFSGDSATPVLNGVASNSGAATFSSSTWTQGTPTTHDTIGGFAAPPTTAAAQFQGRIAEVAIWSGRLSADQWNALGKGFSPKRVKPGGLLLYLPLFGNANPEPDVMNGRNGTITGTIAKARHPRVIA